MGGVATGCRLWKAGLPSSAKRPYCAEAERHILLECKAWAEERRKCWNWSKPGQPPEFYIKCALVPEDPVLERVWEEMMMEEGESDHEEHPSSVQSGDELSGDSGVYGKVAGDGACPRGQEEIRAAGSGHFYQIPERT